MAGGVRQLAFDLASPPALGRDDFVAAEPNSGALTFIDAWPDWPSPAAVLVGPAGSGKSHLAAIWCASAQAATISSDRLTIGAVPALLAAGALVVEDLPGRSLDEQALFHALNLAREQGASLLLTARTLAATWPIALPDLRSRLLALPSIRIGAPDDALLCRVLVKLFSDRQLVADPGVLDYLVTRMERSLGAARTLTDVLDRLSLERSRPITRPLAAEGLTMMRADEGGSG